MADDLVDGPAIDATPPEGTKISPAEPVRPKLPEKPEGFRRLKIYSAIWRGDPGDSIRGAVLGAQPNELPDGTERVCIMVQLEAPAICLVFDETPDEEKELRPVGKVSVTASQNVGIIVTGPALARLLAYAEQPTIAQRVQIHAIDPIDGKKGVANPLSGKRVRYLCFLAEKPAERAEVDPSEIARLEEVRALARQNGG